jgi:hypothetical protein
MRSKLISAGIVMCLAVLVALVTVVWASTPPTIDCAIDSSYGAPTTFTYGKLYDYCDPGTGDLYIFNDWCTPSAFYSPCDAYNIFTWDGPTCDWRLQIYCEGGWLQKNCGSGWTNVSIGEVVMCADYRSTVNEATEHPVWELKIKSALAGATPIVFIRDPKSQPPPPPATPTFFPGNFGTAPTINPCN